MQLRQLIGLVLVFTLLQGFKMAGFENDVAYAKNADFTSIDNQSPSEANGLATNGQLWIGATSVNVGGTHINVGTLTSPDSSMTIGYSSPNITLQVAGGTTVGKTITGNSGGARPPTAGNWNFVTSNSTVSFAGAASTFTQNFNLTNLCFGTSLPLLTSGSQNVSAGFNTMAALTSGVANTIIGANSALALSVGNANTIIGVTSFQASSGGSNNCGMGGNFLRQATSGDNNAGFGGNNFANMLTGNNNTSLGVNAGNAYNSSETGNILIGYNVQGTAGENDTTRIGLLQTKCFIAGINGNTVSNAEYVTIDSTTGQLGTSGPASTFSGSQSAPVSSVSGNNMAYTVIINSTTINENSVLDTSTGTFTPLTSGNYHFDFNVLLNDGNGFDQCDGFIYVNGVGQYRVFGALTVVSNLFSVVLGSTIIPLVAGDAVNLVIQTHNPANATTTDVIFANFSGNLI